MKIKLIYLLALAILLSIFHISAQENKDTTTKVGGTFKPYTSNEEPTILDNAELSVTNLGIRCLIIKMYRCL